MSKPKVIAIVGPTASGKTSLSIDIAKHVGGQVISADSRQVYRGLDIGTGKVTTEEMDGVPHHLLDVVDPSEVFTGANFLRQAGAAIDSIKERGHFPIIAGGTFFYVDLLRGKMAAAPVKPDEDFRASLEKYSDNELLELLETKDARRASTIEPHNRRRLVRALEIINTLGSVPEATPTDSPYEWLILGIDVDKETLREKFAARLTEWMDCGLLEEVERVRGEIHSSRFMEFGFEYTLVAEYLDKEITKDELYEKFIQKNWQYAKRQMTWLKRDEEVEWVNPKDRDGIMQRVDQFLAE